MHESFTGGMKWSNVGVASHRRLWFQALQITCHCFSSKLYMLENRSNHRILSFSSKVIPSKISMICRWHVLAVRQISPNTLIIILRMSPESPWATVSARIANRAWAQKASLNRSVNSLKPSGTFCPLVFPGYATQNLLRGWWPFVGN